MESLIIHGAIEPKKIPDPSIKYKSTPFSNVIPVPYRVQDRLQRESRKSNSFWIPALRFTQPAPGESGGPE